jgi:hypothetical protein
MSRITNSSSSQLVKSGQFLILPAAILLALACTCGGTREVLDAPATEIASPTMGIPGGGISTETITALPADLPAPTSMPNGPNPTVAPTSTPTELPPPSGGGEWGLTQSDLQLTEWGQSDLPLIELAVQNFGPDEFHDYVDLVCVGEGVLRHWGGPIQITVPVNYSDRIYISVGTIGNPDWFTVDLGLHTDSYDYGILCSIDAGGHDPNVSNNGVWFAVP